MLRLLCLAVLASAPARAQNRAAGSSGIRVAPAFASGAAPAAMALPTLGAALGAPGMAPLAAAAPAALTLAASAPAPATVPALAVGPRAASSLPVSVAKTAAAVQRAAAGMLAGAPVTGAQAQAAGRDIEDLLTGAKSISGVEAPEAGAAPDETAPTAAELEFAANAGSELGRRADDLGAARGRKSSQMTGADFVALVDTARKAADAEQSAPSPAAARAASAVRAALLRVVRSLLPENEPLNEHVRRALAVWQVFDQELTAAAGRGSLGAVVSEAELFASQVEASVEPAPSPAPPAPRPEDPDGYAAVSVPGSVFGWRPIEDSPDHGLPPVDALIRRVLSDRQDPARAVGFELAGAPRREDARVYFYGERHTDGGLIAANMARLVADARPGRPIIVLVEGYTGWTLRGYSALSYLADRGLDPDALAAKDVTSDKVEVRGWDTADGYDSSKHPLLQHHMELLELNRLAHEPARGWSYYRDFARAAWRAWRGWLALWKAAIVARNADLDRATAAAADDADASGATVHVIAGSDHLMQNPRLGIFFPRLARPAFRASLAAALAGRSYWASRPAETSAPD
jgi:hypothetical protein